VVPGTGKGRAPLKGLRVLEIVESGTRSTGTLRRRDDRVATSSSVVWDDDSIGGSFISGAWMLSVSVLGESSLSAESLATTLSTRKEELTRGKKERGKSSAEKSRPYLGKVELTSTRHL